MKRGYSPRIPAAWGKRFSRATANGRRAERALLRGWHRVAFIVLGFSLFLGLSCATGGFGARKGEERAGSADRREERYQRILRGYQFLPEEQRRDEMIYFLYLLRSIYESRCTAPDETWPSVGEAVGPVILELLHMEDERRDDVFFSGPAVKMIPPLDLREAIPPLRQMVGSRDVYLARQAIEALGRLGDTESIPEIRKRLEPRTRSGHFGGGLDMTTPQYAAAALWRMGDIQGASILNDLLTHPAQSVRVQSALALAEMGDATGIRVLETRLQNPGAFRIPVLEALSYLDHPRAAQLLEREMNVGDMRGRLLAALYLAEKGNVSARRFLWKTAESSNPEDAYTAAMHLARLRDRTVARVLESLVDQVDVEKRIAAAGALAWLRSEAGYQELVATLEHEQWSYRAVAATLLLLFE